MSDGPWLYERFADPTPDEAETDEELYEETEVERERDAEEDWPF